MLKPGRRLNSNDGRDTQETHADCVRSSWCPARATARRRTVIVLGVDAVRLIRAVIMLSPAALLLVACDSGTPSDVKKEVALGLAEIDLVDSGPVGLQVPMLMSASLPRVRLHWERAAALLERARVADDKKTKLVAVLNKAVGVCRDFEAQYTREGYPFVGMLEESQFESPARSLAAAFDLKLKPPRQATDKEPWFRPELIRMDGEPGEVPSKR